MHLHLTFEVVVALISEFMHMNSAYFAEIVLMRALFPNLDYSPCYQEKEGERKKTKPLFFSSSSSLFAAIDFGPGPRY